MSAHNQLLHEWQDRPRLLGRDTGHHPQTLRRVVAELDAGGPSEAADCIQSLVFELEIVRNRANRFAEELLMVSK